MCRLPKPGTIRESEKPHDKNCGIKLGIPLRAGGIVARNLQGIVIKLRHECFFARNISFVIPAFAGMKDFTGFI